MSTVAMVAMLHNVISSHLDLLRTRAGDGNCGVRFLGHVNNWFHPDNLLDIAVGACDSLSTGNLVRHARL